MAYKGPNLDVFEEDLEKRLANAIDSIQDGEVKIRDVTQKAGKWSKEWKRIFSEYSEIYALMRGKPDIAYFVAKDGKVYQLSQFKNPFNISKLTENQELEKLDLHPLTVFDEGHLYIQMNAEFGKELPITYHGKRRE